VCRISPALALLLPLLIPPFSQNAEAGQPMVTCLVVAGGVAANNKVQSFDLCFQL
jgi:tRNA A37 threonylcarbamoyltransferase TsaD